MIKLYSSKILEQIKENYVVGVLASEGEYIPRLGDEQLPVTYSNQMDDVIFFVKPLSQEPKEILEAQESSNMTNLYIGFGSKSISNLPLEFKYNSNTNEKIEYIKELLSGKLLVFKPVLTQKSERYHKNIDDLIVEEEWKQGLSYYAVPKVNLKPVEFESKLLAEEAINLERYNHAMPAPLYILCGNYIYGNIKENQWRIDSSINHNARVIISPDNVKRVEITEDEKQEFIGSDRDSIVFFDEEFINTIIADRLDFNGMKLGELEEEILMQEEPEQGLGSGRKDENTNNTNQIHEITFIRDLESKAKSRNLVYSREDLVNFHTSVKSSAMTILSGQSGIGKTKLATIYGETLGLSQEKKTMLIMPISPAYTEPGDILGYLNPSSGLYMPAETGLVEFLLHAEENENQVHMLIMDEMNLSQIEHYFAPFISLLELEERERFLHLYSKGSVCHNGQTYKHSIQLKNNLVIVGTMNTDETTKDLSDRLLDRSNVVVLEKRSFTDIKNELENFDRSLTYNSGLEDAYGEVYMTWKSKNENWNAFEDQELEFFDELDSFISNVDPLKGFSIRSLIRMGAYINNLPADSSNEYNIERREAIDLFIKQRVITKIRGPIELYEGLIGVLEVGGQEPNGALFSLFSSNAANQISNFNKTKNELIRKARELSLNGYAT
ncbi:AAA family ATPase [Sporosarcina sp. Sa2YVA2]|uniref:AAA family ATPase n=1 Tax=Sporosarcina quadrami TaxID=2762234 RepID=A0ABR8UD66_9BACL|nr:AAA family ATPase [Sporosarcina quadrami]MBD7985951.1 AAA family ATPase [Sporosarcina quadrami]